MKHIDEIQRMINAPRKVMEKSIGIKIRNGQGKEGVIKALKWVLEDHGSIQER